MKPILIVVTCFLISCNNSKNEPNTTEIKKDSVITTDSTEPAAVLIYTRYVPVNLLQHLSASLPEWSIPDPSAWEKRWWDYYKTNVTLVNYMPGDFNCDGAKDYAMVLTNRNNNVAAWAFLAKGNSFENKKLDEFQNISGQIGCGLMPLHAGKHGDLNNEDVNYRVDVKCPGITLVFFEKAARSYYLEKGKVKWIQSGD